MWGYDRDEVDQLLASVVVSIERLQRRRQRDGEAIERATAEARRATDRAERAERDRDELAKRLELADEALEQARADADRRVQRLVAEAQAEAQAQAEAEAQAERGRQPGDPGRGADGLPLALRAARALLADARERSVTIEAEAHRRAQEMASGSADDGGRDSDHSNRSGSSATIHS